MPTLTILTNAAQGTDVTIRDMGIIIPNSGGSETFTDTRNLKKARLSTYLRTLVTDDAHGANSSTLIINNGTDNIVQASVLTFLDSLDVPLKHNETATTSPGVNDDSADGYSVGSRWTNTSTDNEYVCLDNTLGAARWDVGGYNNNNAITVGVSSTITTTSQSFVTVTGMSATPGAGTYWVTYSCSSSYNKNSEAIHLGIFSGTNTAEVTDVTTVADVGGNLGGTYFNICAPGDVNTSTDGYDVLLYVWINTGGSTDPAPAGRTGIEVTIAPDDTANTVASAVQTAVNGNANFTASVTTNVVTITCVEARAVISAADIDTGFTINVTTEGSPHASEGAFREIGGQSGNFGNPNCQGEIVVATDTDFLEARWGITNNGGGGAGTMALGRVLYAVRTS